MKLFRLTPLLFMPYLWSCGQAPKPVVQPTLEEKVATPIEEQQSDFATVKDLDARYWPVLEGLDSEIQEAINNREKEIEKQRVLLKVDEELVQSLAKSAQTTEGAIFVQEERLQELALLLQQAQDIEPAKGDEIQRKMDLLETSIETQKRKMESELQEVASKQASIEKRKGLDEDGLFDLSVRPLFEEAIDKWLEFYEAGTTYSNRVLATAPVPGVKLVSEVFSDQHQVLKELAKDPELPIQIYHPQQKAFEGDRRLFAAIDLGWVVQAHFDTGIADLESLLMREKEDLELLTSRLVGRWDSYPDLMIMVDGHADQQTYPGSQCISSGRNTELSRRRAQAIEQLFVDRLGSVSRIRFDWFGNFFNQAELTGEQSDRRIELRIVAIEAEAPDQEDSLPANNKLPETQEELAAHAGYLNLREEAVWGTRKFRRSQGRWIDTKCWQQEVDKEIQYASSQYQNFVHDAEIDPEEVLRLDLGQDVRYNVRLGNSFVAKFAGQCVQIAPCTE